MPLQAARGLQGLHQCPSGEASGEEASEVVRFYAGRRVLVTGASGFMGKVLVEKLLRSCPDLGGVVVLLRPKKDRDVDARLRDMLAMPLFDAVRRRDPGVLAKVKAVRGDVSLPRLGLSPADRAHLANTVSVVFHAAATVRFNEHLRKAADVNVAGTQAVLDLCRDMAGLVALLHVSTAFCACTRRMVQELVYPSPMSAATLRAELAARDDAAVESDTARLIGAYPNTYTFTKAVAEAVILEEGKELPVVIVRPSIVSPSWREPVPGWVDNWNGPVGPWVSIGKGTLSCVFGRADVVADFVPVDVCIDLMVAAAWDVHAHADLADARRAGVAVYNCVSGASNPVTWGDSTDLWVQGVRRRPYASTLGTPTASFTTSRAAHHLRTLAGQLVRAYAVDAVAMAAARKSPRLADLVWKQCARMRSLEFFTTREFAFQTDNVRALWSRMSDADRLAFPFAEVAVMDWGQYLAVVLEGTKTFLLHEDAAAASRDANAAGKTRSRILRAYSTQRLLPLLAVPLLAVNASPLLSKL
ncbi:putative fatty acyl-CoA reductase CG5065 isoform X2 [Thrips palmi]|nr:putative fatty acyl-CoA reductase CG5065 isoform X2 [Thrips palmi]XP_034241041.1 putative fatty acyl-CoA reductase CG5065 isoform X2 [Thrips palmi]